MKNLKELVFEALNNALENEYDFRLTNPVEVAADLVDYDASFEYDRPVDLVVHIVAWQKSKREEGPNSRESRMARGAYLGQVAPKSETR